MKIKNRSSMGNYYWPKDSFLSRRIRHYTSGVYHRKIKLIEASDFYEEVKDLFYDRIQYKWKVKNGIHYINNMHLDKYVFCLFLRDLIEVYAKDHPSKTNYKGFKKFIENIQSNPKTIVVGSPYKIRIKKGYDNFEILSSIYELAGKLEANHSTIIEMMYSNIKFQISKSTFTRLYYDNLNSEKK